MIALSMVLRGRTMSLGGVFMMLSCFVMCVFCHMGVLWNRYFDSLNQDFRYRLPVSDSILPPASLAVVGTQFVSCASPKSKRLRCRLAIPVITRALCQFISGRSRGKFRPAIGLVGIRLAMRFPPDFGAS